MRGSVALVATLAAAVPDQARAADCASRPDLCGRPVQSDIAEPNLAVAHDVVFLGDGYRGGDLGLFAQHVAAFVSELKAGSVASAIVPNDPTLFNVHRVDVVSPTDDVGDRDRADTAFGAIATGFDAITYDAASLLFAAAQNAPDADTVVLVVNASQGRASATYPAAHTTGGRCAVPAGGAGTGVLPHEMGHAIFRLADEYEAYTACWTGTEAEVASLPNVTRAPSGAKFARAGTPTPYEGAYYHRLCAFRPASACLMRVLTAGWCPVCARHVKTQIAERRQGDQDAPYPVLVEPRDGQVVVGATAVSGVAYDSLTFARLDLLVDGVVRQTTTARNLSTTWNAAAEPPGAHTIALVATDGAGHAERNSIAVTVSRMADARPPSVALAWPPSGTILSGAPTLYATAADDVGVERVEFSADGAPIGLDTVPPYEVVWDTLRAPDGVHALTATARDGAGNATTTGAVPVGVRNARSRETLKELEVAPRPPGRIGIPVAADDEPPRVRILEPAEGDFIGRFARVAAEASDDVAVFDVTVLANGRSIGAWAIADWDTGPWTEGPVTLVAVARDLVGNAGWSSPVRVVIDRTPPEVRIASPAEGAPLEVVVEAADANPVARVALEVDGAALGARSEPPYTFGLDAVSAGVHVLVARAFDGAGNEAASEPVVRRVDRTSGGCGCRNGGETIVAAAVPAMAISGRRRRRRW